MAKNDNQQVPETTEDNPTGEVDEEYSPKELPRPTKPDKIALEKELRQYVKRAGGFRRGLSKKHQARARDILKLLGRKGISWDLSLKPDTPAGQPGQTAPSPEIA